MELLDTSNHREVYIACTPVSAQWRDLGTRLGLSQNTLATIQADNPRSTINCLSAMITAWLRRPERDMSDSVQPTWRNLCLALSHIHKPLAESISKEHGCNYISTTVSEATSKSGVPPAFLAQSCGCGQCTIKGWMTGRECQNMYVDRRPKLLVVNPDNPEVEEVIELEWNYARQARLARETSNLVKSFRNVSLETWKYLQQCLQEGKCTISDVTFQVTIWMNKPRPMISQFDELQNWFHSLRVSWFNFRPLQFVNETFLSEYPDLMATWSNYCSAFKEYCSTRSLKSYVNVFFQVEDQNVFLLEVDEWYHNFTLSDIEALCDSLSLALDDVPSVCLHLLTVRGGSLIIYFHYCYSDYLMIFKSLTTQQLKSISQIEAYKILSLTDLHNQFKYDNIQKYNSHDKSPHNSTLKEDLSKSEPAELGGAEGQEEIVILRKMDHEKVLSISALTQQIQELKSQLRLNEEHRKEGQEEIAILRKMDHEKVLSISTLTQQIQELESELRLNEEHTELLKKQSHGKDRELSQLKAKSKRSQETKATQTTQLHKETKASQTTQLHKETKASQTTQLEAELKHKDFEGWNDKPKLEDLDLCLQDVVKKWERFALNLPGIDQTELDIIENDNPGDIVKQKLELYKVWLRVYPNASWDDVTKALEGAGENTIARQLKAKYGLTKAELGIVPLSNPNSSGAVVISPRSLVDSVPTVTANTFRRHYYDLYKAIGPFPDLLLSVSTRFYQCSLIDLQTKVNINRSGGEAGASMLLDHVMMKIEQSDHYLPLVMDILREEVVLTDIVHKMEESAADNQGSALLTDTTVITLSSTGSPHDPISSPDTTVADTILAAERLKDAFESLCSLAMMIINQTTINLGLLKLKICFRLQYIRNSIPPELLKNLEQCPNAESIFMFLINNHCLGYLNFDLLEAFKPVLLSDKFDENLKEYQLAHKQFIKNNFQNIVEVFNQKPRLRPASIVGLPEIKVELATPWKSKSLYYWKDLVNDIVDWDPHIVITRVEFN